MKYLPLLLLLFISMVQANELPINLSGLIEIENKTYFREPHPDLSDNGRNQVRLLLKTKSPTDRNLRFFSAVELRADEVDSSRNRIFFKEGYIDYEKERFDLRIGKQIYSWGRADGINPTNNLNPTDYRDLFDTDEEEIGVISLSSRYYRDKMTLETVVIPIFEPAILPAPDSRWNLFPSALANVPRNETRPAKNLDQAQLAARLSMTSGGWDYSTSFYRGFEKYPSVFFLPDPATLLLKYRKLQVLGVDLATSFDKLGLRGEAGYFFPGEDDPYLQYVLGLDYNFSNLIGEQDLFLLGQWIQEVSGTDSADDDLRHLFQKAFMLKAEWGFTDFTKFSLQGIYRLQAKDIYLQSILSSNIADDVNIEVGLDLFYGKKGSLMERFKDNQRIFGRLKYTF